MDLFINKVFDNCFHGCIRKSIDDYFGEFTNIFINLDKLLYLDV